MSASIRQTVHKNVTIFTGINAEKNARMVKYCHQQLIADALIHSRETLCSVKRIMIHYMLSLKRRNLKQQNQLRKNLLPQPKLKALLTMEGRQPLHLMSKLTLERNLVNFRRKDLLMSLLLKKRMPKLSQLQVKRSLLMNPLLKKSSLLKRLLLKKRSLLKRLLLKKRSLLKRLSLKKRSLLKIPLLKKRSLLKIPLLKKRSLLKIPLLKKRSPLKRLLSKMRMLVLNQLKSLLKNLQNHNFQVGYLTQIETIMIFQMSLKAQ